MRVKMQRRKHAKLSSIGFQFTFLCISLMSSYKEKWIMLLFFMGYICVCVIIKKKKHKVFLFIIRFLCRMLFEPGYFITRYFSNNSVRLIFVAGIRGKCWEVSRPWRERAADCRVLSRTLPVTDGEKKTVVVKE